jgi:hypothetical protein
MTRHAAGALWKASDGIHTHLPKARQDAATRRGVPVRPFHLVLCPAGLSFLPYRDESTNEHQAATAASASVPRR